MSLDLDAKLDEKNTKFLMLDTSFKSKQFSTLIDRHHIAFFLINMT